jgi:DNA polymerase-4
VSESDLVAIFGTAHGVGLHRLAMAEDDRPVVTEREAKSISVEETFDTDLTDRSVLESELARMAERVSGRLAQSSLFARTVTVKARHHDFSTQTRSSSLPFATGDRTVVLREGRHLLAGIDVSTGLRLLGLGVSGLTGHAQEELALGTAYPQVVVDAPDAGGASATEGSEEADESEVAVDGLDVELLGRRSHGWSTGQDVVHDEHGAGWVWGSGLGRVTVRFEGPRTAPGPVRTFAADDAALRPASPPDWREESA